VQHNHVVCAVLVGVVAHQSGVQLADFVHEFTVPKGRIVGVISDQLQESMGQFIQPNYCFSYARFTHEYFGF